MKPVEVRIKSEMGVLGDTDFPRLIMSRAGVRPARDIINLGIYVSVRDAQMKGD